ncbi:hypothetical protein CPB86DRAFT_780903 [Serendipita vermifera]|nr:hypothetical protein CPB86DRAFT_780903 [Serendipita vermifera]
MSTQIYALSVTTPSGWISGQFATLSWSLEHENPRALDIKLVNRALLPRTITLATKINTYLERLVTKLPDVPPGDGYTLEFTDCFEPSQTYTSSGPFRIDNEKKYKRIEPSEMEIDRATIISIVPTTTITIVSTVYEPANTTTLTSTSFSTPGPQQSLTLTLTRSGASTNATLHAHIALICLSCLFLHHISYDFL